MIGADRTSRLHRIFEELQEKGLIDYRRRLVRCPFTISLRGCPALNCIRYRHSFYENDLSKASDDSLRFALLHEEGHVRRGSPLISALPALPALLCFALFGHPSLQPGGFPATKLALIVPLLLATLFTYRVYYRRMYDEEFAADRYAADAMRRCYRIGDPGVLLQSLLSGFHTRTASPCREGMVAGIFRSGHDYQPPISERVQRLRATGSFVHPAEGDGRR